MKPKIVWQGDNCRIILYQETPGIDRLGYEEKNGRDLLGVQRWREFPHPTVKIMNEKEVIQEEEVKRLAEILLKKGE